MRIFLHKTKANCKSVKPELKKNSDLMLKILPSALACGNALVGSRTAHECSCED